MAPACSGGVEDRGELAGACHAGLVDHHHHHSGVETHPTGGQVVGESSEGAAGDARGPLQLAGYDTGRPVVAAIEIDWYVATEKASGVLFLSALAVGPTGQG